MELIASYGASLIRTWVPIWVATGIALLAAKTGIVFDDTTDTYLTLGASGAAISTWYALVRAVEVRWPGLGRVLLTLGLSKAGAPAYDKPIEANTTRVD